MRRAQPDLLEDQVDLLRHRRPAEVRAGGQRLAQRRRRLERVRQHHQPAVELDLDLGDALVAPAVEHGAGQQRDEGQEEQPEAVVDQERGHQHHRGRDQLDPDDASSIDPEQQELDVPVEGGLVGGQPAAHQRVGVDGAEHQRGGAAHRDQHDGQVADPALGLGHEVVQPSVHASTLRANRERPDGVLTGTPDRSAPGRG